MTEATTPMPPRTPHLAHRALTMHPLNITNWNASQANEGFLSRSGDPEDPGNARRTKVAIVGAGLGKQEAPYDDPDWEVWALNVCGAWDAEGRLRADRWFELHEMHAQSLDDLRWMQQCPCPIYLVPQAFAGGRATPETRDGETFAFPRAVRFPLEKLEDKFGGYWACTFAYQMALALHEGFTDVGLFGVELAFGTERERTIEWACVSYWIGRLEGAGVTLHFPEGSLLGQHRYRYGVEYDDEIAWAKRYLKVVGGMRDARQLIGMGD